MKRLNLIIGTVFFFTINSTFAQTKEQEDERPIEPNPNFDPSTNCRLRYYYYPNLQAYYDTQKKIYFLSKNGEWQISEYIPSGCMGYSIYNKTNVIINDYDDDFVIQFLPKHKKIYPYVTNERIRKQYASK